MQENERLMKVNRYAFTVKDDSTSEHISSRIKMDVFQYACNVNSKYLRARKS